MGGDVVCLWKQNACLGMRVDGFKRGTLLDGVTQAYIPNAFEPVLRPNGDRSYLRPLDDLTHPYKTAVGKAYDVGVEVSRCPAGQMAFSRVYHPFKDVMSLEEFEEWSFPMMDKKELDDIGARAKDLYENTDKAICGVFNGGLVELGTLYWGYENFYCNLVDEECEDMIERYLEKRTDLLIEDLKNYLDACGKYISCIMFADDLGTQQSLLISPATYREKIKPCHKRMFDFVHKNYPEVKVLFHSCGAIYDLIPDFIPVLGSLDDLILLPALIALTIKLIPGDVWAECREKSGNMWADGKPKKWYYAIPFVFIWALIIFFIVKAIWF